MPEVWRWSHPDGAGWVGSNNSGQYIRSPGFHLFNASVKVDRYDCAGYGFIEEWVQNPKDMARMIKKAEPA